MSSAAIGLFIILMVSWQRVHGEYTFGILQHYYRISLRFHFDILF